MASAGLLLALTAPMAAFAQNLPPGSYLQSCGNASVVDGTLIAQCRRGDQTLRNTSLPNAWRCQGGINNIDGKLECGVPANVPPPPPAPPQTSEFTAGRSKVSNLCRDGATVYLAFRMRGAQDNEVRVMLDAGATMKIDVPRGTSYASECGHPVGPQSGYRYMNVGLINDLGAERHMP